MCVCAITSPLGSFDDQLWHIQWWKCHMKVQVCGQLAAVQCRSQSLEMLPLIVSCEWTNTVCTYTCTYEVLLEQVLYMKYCWGRCELQE